MDVMQLRRSLMMMHIAEHGLPAEYLQVEYLESTGTQKIDTGISGGCEIDLTAKSRETSSSVQIVVGRDYSGGTYFGKTDVWTLGSTVKFSYGVTEWQTIQAVFSASSLSCTIGSETKTRNGTASYSNNYFIFATGVNDNYNASVMIKSCTIYQNGAKVRDLIPCVRISDSKPGMYDLVGRTFYTNAGTGEFIAGIVLLPEQDGFVQKAKIPVVQGKHIKMGWDTTNLSAGHANATVVSMFNQVSSWNGMNSDPTCTGYPIISKQINTSVYNGGSVEFDMPKDANLFIGYWQDSDSDDRRIKGNYINIQIS